MRRKHLCLAVAALLAVGGLWLARTSTPVEPTAVDASSTDSALKEINGGRGPGQMSNAPAQHAPPVPTQRFKEFTPEQRVEFARRGHGPGG